MGFTFDDTDDTGTASSHEEMKQLIAHDPRNQQLIFPYIGGDEVNDRPNQTHHRYVINFGDRTLEEAGRWPELLAIISRKVKPERLKKTGSYQKYWWQFGRRNVIGQNKINTLSRVLVCARHQPNWCVSFMPSSFVFSEALVIFAYETEDIFALLQSRIHEVWTRFFASSLEDRLRYTPTDCFETFPFPSNTTQLAPSEIDYDASRRQLMHKASLGLTKSYNRFHSPDERDPDILELRRLHGEMDVAVLRAYGWNDLADQAAQPGFCKFLLDYEEDEDDTASDASSTRQKKKPWRYRWPDDFRDEVLARLLELNEQRHQEEVLAGVAGTASKRPSDDDDSDSDQDDDAPKPKKPTKNTKTPKTTKRPPASGQQEMDF